MHHKSLSSLAIAAVCALVLGACGSGGDGTGTSSGEAAAPAAAAGDTAWSFTPRLAEPLTATAGPTEVILGDLAKYGIEVTIPAGAFADPTEVSLSDPEGELKYASVEVTGFGTPFEISAGDGTPVRLQQPATVRMTYDPAVLGTDELESLRFAYLNGDAWTYMKPEVDEASNVMSFMTSHFSLFGQAKATTEEQLKEWSSNAAVNAWSSKEGGKLADKAVEKAIDAALERLKIGDTTIKEKVIQSILKDDEYGDIIKGAATGDVAQANQAVNILIGKKIVENVPAGRLSKALGGVTSDFGAGTVAKASEAAGYLAEGRAKDAAKIIGEHLADRFLATHILKAAVAQVNNQISSWKNAEIEAAYQAFKNGASSSVPWWGYQVEKGNFQDVWTQMGGAARQLELEAIRAQNAVREEAGMPPLDAAEEEKIRQQVQSNLKAQFEDRVKADAEIEANKAQIDMVMKMYKDAGLLEKGMWGYDSGEGLEQRADILMKFANKLLADTGRGTFRDGFGHNDISIGTEDLKSAAMAWFGAKDTAAAKAEYAKFLQDQFGISMAPPPKALNGSWSSASTTLTEWDLGPAPEPNAKGTGEGCDLDSAEIYASMQRELKKQKGKAQKTKMSLKLDANGQGTLTITPAGGNKMTLPATYVDGVLTASKKDKQNGEFIFNGNVSGTEGDISVTGDWRLNLPAKDRTAWVAGTWGGTK